jgi:hypothetical protein
MGMAECPPAKSELGGDPTTGMAEPRRTDDLPSPTDMAASAALEGLAPGGRRGVVLEEARAWAASNALSNGSRREAKRVTAGDMPPGATLTEGARMGRAEVAVT